jgi:very-short-patch-repair endonuclease
VRTTLVDEAVLGVARHQHGVFSREQAFAAGASIRFIERRLAGGAWIRIDNAVYALPSFAPTYLRQLKAAELGSRGAAIAGRAAAAFHELTGFRPVRPEILVPPTVRARTKLADVHRYAGAQIVVEKGLRVTSVAQTLFDVVRRVPLLQYERALDDALLVGKVTVEHLEERLRFYEGSRRKGMPLLRALVAERREDGWVPPESELEAIAAKILARFAGRARFDRQVTLRWRSGAEARVDFIDKRHRIIVEVDGRRWHTRVADFDRDLWRTNEAVAHGYVVLRFTWVHLTEAVDDVDALLAAAIAERSGIAAPV